MRLSIHFNDHLAGNTGEIRKERANRMVTPEFEACQRTVAKGLPQQTFGRHGPFAKGTGQVDRLGVSGHRLPPSPLPLSPRRYCVPRIPGPDRRGEMGSLLLASLFKKRAIPG